MYCIALKACFLNFLLLKTASSGKIMTIFKRQESNPYILIKNSCERIFKRRYQIYDEDVISDAMASIIFQYRKNNTKIESLDAWIVGAIHYHYVAYLKRKEKENLFTYNELIVDSSENEAYPHTRLESQEIFSEIENLEKPYNTIIQLRILEGLSYNEIAKQLNMNAATARKYFQRGIFRLKKALQLISLLIGLNYA